MAEGLRIAKLAAEHSQEIAKYSKEVQRLSAELAASERAFWNLRVTFDATKVSQSEANTLLRQQLTECNSRLAELEKQRDVKQINHEVSCTVFGSGPCTCGFSPLRERNAELEKQLEQERIQHAGCLTAAEGWAKDPPVKGDWAWSPAFQVTLELHQKYETVKGEKTQLQSDVERLVGALQQISTICTTPCIEKNCGNAQHEAFRLAKSILSTPSAQRAQQRIAERSK